MELDCKDGRGGGADRSVSFRLIGFCAWRAAECVSSAAFVALGAINDSPQTLGAPASDRGDNEPGAAGRTVAGET
eukprot:scaffold22045_cov111-Isochrysis_galbana.AAC.6